jgi:4-methoxybenzoate monooxygenase (O-demethylating)
MLFNSFGPERGSLTSSGLGMQLCQAADEGRFPAENAAELVRSISPAGFDTTAIITGSATRLTASPRTLSSGGFQAKILSCVAPRLTRSFAGNLLCRHFPHHLQGGELVGVRIGPDEKRLLFLAAANRDPRRWEKADEFDLRRNAAGHLAFGSGIRSDDGAA